MISSKLIVNIPSGLHLRPVGILCNRANLFQSTISIKARDKTVNAKSVLGLLSAGVKEGDEIEIICDGVDEENALSTLINLFQSDLEINSK